MPQGIPIQFLLNSGESHVVVTNFTHIQSGLQQNLLFYIFQYWKMLKMLKIGCFKLFKAKLLYLRCASSIPMQCFAQQW